MKAARLIQLIAVGILIVSVIALGVEIFVNDAENSAAVWIYVIIALVCLNLNAFIAIFRLWKTGSAREKTISIFLALLIIIFWALKAAGIV